MYNYITVEAQHAETPLEVLAEMMVVNPTFFNNVQIAIILARRLAAVEAVHTLQDTSRVPVVERDIRKVVTSLQVLLMAVENKLDDALARIIELEKAAPDARR